MARRPSSGRGNLAILVKASLKCFHSKTGSKLLIRKSIAWPPRSASPDPSRCALPSTRAPQVRFPTIGSRPRNRRSNTSFNPSVRTTWLTWCPQNSFGSCRNFSVNFPFTSGRQSEVLPLRIEGTNLVTYRLQLLAQGLAAARHRLATQQSREHAVFFRNVMADRESSALFARRSRSCPA